MVVKKPKNSVLVKSLFFMYLKSFQLLVPQFTFILLIVLNYNSVRLGYGDFYLKSKVILYSILFNLPILSYTVYRLWKEGYNKTGYVSVNSFLTLFDFADKIKKRIFKFTYNFLRFLIFYFIPLVSMYKYFGINMVVFMFSAHLVARLFIYYFIRERQYVELSDNILLLFKPTKKEEVELDDDSI